MNPADLMEHATNERQREVLRAVIQHGSAASAARALGVARGTVNKLIQRLRQRAESGVGLDDETMDHIDARRIPGASVYTQLPNGDRAWLKNGPERANPEELLQRLQAAAEGWLQDGPAAVLVKPPELTHDDMLSLYGFGDPHMGLLCWGAEVGENFDTAINSSTTLNAMRRMVSVSPPSAYAVLVFIGDNTHTNDQRNVTPRSGHQLDVDGRYPRVLEATLQLMVGCVDLALVKHGAVRVDVVKGNHDPEASAALRLALFAYYRNEPRVDVADNHNPYHYLRWGRCLFGFHHGHGAKMEALGAVMATDRPEDWGQTEHRHWRTGHIHHRKSLDLRGCEVTSLRTLAPTDGHAHLQGYRGRRGMQLEVFHRERGRLQLMEHTEVASAS